MKKKVRRLTHASQLDNNSTYKITSVQNRPVQWQRDGAAHDFATFHKPTTKLCGGGGCAFFNKYQERYLPCCVWSALLMKRCGGALYVLRHVTPQLRSTHLCAAHISVKYLFSDPSSTIIMWVSVGFCIWGGGGGGGASQKGREKLQQKGTQHSTRQKEASSFMYQREGTQ